MTSSAVSQVVSDLSVDIAGAGSSTATVSPGGTATYNLSIAPSTGTTFPAAVTLSATGGPTGSTITITPQTISAGAGATTVTLTVQVPAATAVVRSSNAWVLGFWIPLIGMLSFPFGSERRRAPFKRVLLTMLLLIGVAGTIGIVGCGGGTQTTSTTRQPTNYTIIVTAASGSVSHSTSLTLTVR